MKKALNITKTIVTWLLVIISIAMMIFTVVSVSTFDNKEKDIFGYRFYIVRTGSMSATDFDAGDLIVSKKVDDVNSLSAGDIITFESADPDNAGEIVTHKIREVTDENGAPAFRTYGTTTNADDPTLVPFNLVMGKYVGSIPNVGFLFEFIKSTQGYILCIFLPFLLLILIQIFNSIRLFRKYKSEQNAEISAEREKLAEEREESRKMMEELQKLKAQLGEGAANTEKSPAEKDEPVVAGGEDEKSFGEENEEKEENEDEDEDDEDEVII